MTEYKGQTNILGMAKTVDFDRKLFFSPKSMFWLLILEVSM